jgi:hypothetical protein
MLRSAWRGLGASATDAPFAVDLSSDRVRRAVWLLDGVRNGYELGDLLGQRLERRLHDAALDAYIEDVREAVLATTGHQGDPATAIVDGLEVATAYRDSEAGSDLHQRLEAIRTAAPTADRQPLLDVFSSTEADFDAVADVLMTQGVVALLQGNMDAAAASAATVGSNPGGVPEVTVADVPTSGNVVSHRILVAFPPAAVDPAAPLVRQVGAALDDWLASLLPAFAGLHLTVRWAATGDLPETHLTITLGALGVSASHLVSWCQPATPTESSRLAELAAAVLAVEGETRVAVVDGTEIEEVAVVAAALGEALGAGRPLSPADLIDSTAVSDSMTASATIDLAELGDRADHVAARLRVLAGQVTTSADRTVWVAEAALCEYGGAMAACREPAAATALGEALLARAAALDGVERGDADALAAGIATAVGGTIPVLPELTGVDDLAAAAAASAGRLKDRVDPWLLAAGRVHDGAGAVHQALLLAEAAGERRCLDASLVQYPDVPDEGWAAIDLPDFAAGRSRLCLLSIADIGTAAAAGRLSGVVFDGWSEVVPGTTVTTGVAVHFDSPSSRGPQAILLAMPPAGQNWSTPAMFQTLRQTLQAAKNRAVGPETLDSYGHLLPAVFIDDQAIVVTEDELTGPTTSGSM